MNWYSTRELCNQLRIDRNHLNRKLLQIGWLLSMQRTDRNGAYRWNDDDLNLIRIKLEDRAIAIDKSKIIIKKNDLLFFLDDLLWRIKNQILSDNDKAIIEMIKEFLKTYEGEIKK